MSMKNIAIVSGASSGIGREFVRQLDEKEAFDEIWVIARRAERLEELKPLVRAKIVPIQLDLTDPASTEAYGARLKDEQPNVKVLVNAAGYGKIGAAQTLSTKEQSEMVDLNVRALTDMTLLTLPYMQKGAAVYQMASLSSYLPLPRLSVYAATKAYVLSFSRAMNAEIKDRGIRVMAVCPGWVKTEFLSRATEKPLRHYTNMYCAPDIVSRALRDMKRGKSVSIYGAQTRTIIVLSKLLPHAWILPMWQKLQKPSKKEK